MFSLSSCAFIVYFHGRVLHLAPPKSVEWEKPHLDHLLSIWDEEWSHLVRVQTDFSQTSPQSSYRATKTINIATKSPSILGGASSVLGSVSMKVPVLIVREDDWTDHRIYARRSIHENLVILIQTTFSVSKIERKFATFSEADFGVNSSIASL
jgi:hypothetical protein